MRSAVAPSDDSSLPIAADRVRPVPADHVHVQVRHRLLEREERVLAVPLGAEQSFLLAAHGHEHDGPPRTRAGREGLRQAR